MLVTIVVFCTTYALILPAITLEDDTICGYIEHTHSESCYVQSTVAEDGTSTTELICELPEHAHSGACYPVTEATETTQVESQLSTETGTETTQPEPESVSEDTEAESESTAESAQQETEKVAMFAARAANVYQTVSPNSLDNSGGTRYVVYTKYGGKYYAVDGNGKPSQITLDSEGNITSTVDNNLLWSFTTDGGASSYIIKNAGTNKHMHSYRNSSTDKNIITGGAYSSTLLAGGDGSDITFSVKSNANYSQITQSGNNVTFTVTQTASQAAQFYIATLPQSQSVYHVWFDGTNSEIMSLLYADDKYQAVPVDNNTITLPTTWKSTTKYAYKLQGWYDIVSHKYYPAGATVTINQNTVFYADWVAASYDVGQDNEHVVDSLDTNNFITTHVFDYNVLFNVQSLSHIGSISANSHTEAWTLKQTGKVPYNNANTLNFVFIDWDTGGPHFSFPDGLNTQNYNQSVITPGVLDNVKSVSGGVDLLDLLFNPDTKVIGKNYVGTGNYLYQYMDEDTENYDNEHNGYYYFNANLNAASYNQSNSRFYLYDYLERTSDSDKDGGDGTYSDFLPFNSPYVNTNGQVVDTYTYYGDGGKTGYEYDAKDGVSSFKQYNDPSHVTTNYFFGIRSDVDFYLPNDSGDRDAQGNYGNVSTHGEHMIFEFRGDDDVWITVDDQLMLDVGGLHGIEYGQIDFSTGTVTTNQGSEAIVQTFEEILGSGNNIKEGRHKLSIYYMERGSSQSNCAIYFNISPRYNMEIKKEDIYTAELLDGTEFSVYSDEACTIPAELWNSYTDYQEDIKDDVADNSINTFTVIDGYAKCWGISAGKTYYIKETKPPEGYPPTDDIICVTLNNRGFASVEITKLEGGNGKFSEGFAVIEQEIDETLKLVSLTFTNQKDDDTTQVRVQKTWDESSADLPDSISVNLMANDKKVGRTAVLHDGNGWVYTWSGLPKYDDEGKEIQYNVQEVWVPGYASSQKAPEKVQNYVDWIKSMAMQDGSTILLVNNDKALFFNGSSFQWIDIETAENNLAAQWSVSSSSGGYILTNGNNYTITFNGSRFTATNNRSDTLNQTLYFANHKLIALSNDTYYQFGDSGTALSDDGLNFVLYKHELLTGYLVDVTNKPVDEADQTFVKVNKVWADGEAHDDDSVVARLYADGKDTGVTITLNKNNNWEGTFDGLPFYRSDGVTPIVYTVAEDYLPGFDPTYSDPEELEGKKIIEWPHVMSLSSSGIFRFISNGFALATNESGTLVSKANDLNDRYQHWKVVTSGSNFRLQNVGSGAYLYIYRSGWSYVVGTTTNLNSASNITFNANGTLRMASGTTTRYLTLDRNSVGVNSSSGTVLSVSQKTEVYGKPGSGFTITNTLATHILPETGGVGNYVLYIGGLLLTAVSLFLLFKRKRRAGV